MRKSDRTEGVHHYFLGICCALMFAGCCSRPVPVEPIIDDLENQQVQSAAIVERIEVETEKLVPELVYINAPPEIIERATVIVKDAVELKTSLEKERILTADLKIRVETLVNDKKPLETAVNRTKTQRNAGFIACGILAVLLFLAFKLK